MNPFDPTKPCQYRNGEPARILCTDRDTLYPIVSLTKNGSILTHLKNGSIGDFHESQHDLINIPSKKTVEVFITIYNDGTFICSFSAQVPAKHDAFARKKITFEVEEGEGL